MVQVTNYMGTRLVLTTASCLSCSDHTCPWQDIGTPLNFLKAGNGSTLFGDLWKGDEHAGILLAVCVLPIVILPEPKEKAIDPEEAYGKTAIFCHGFIVLAGKLKLVGK